MASASGFANHTPLTVIGIDVGGARKGFHAVALCGGAYRDRHNTADPVALARWCHHSIGAQLVAVDAPCGWSVDGRCRPAERELMAERIPCFSSPSRARALEHPSNYFGWMLCGEALYGALASSHTLAVARPAPGQVCSFETFPHAITTHLHRALGLGPALASAKRVQRRALLERFGVDTGALTSIDWIDAALCALAAQLLAGAGPCRVYGEPASGVLIVPTGVDGPLATLQSAG
ncbi:DUF429 domain-containing protein [Synechococcus sp. CS-1324]|uniref:DUF429 domain-containing protein n=1 Tax=Synechococcus sp. CS-1324 TaxID=2847980 RepID=UPI000DB6786E|nr:DUF429 domain-containing protein [Synechococcus sp. CS-1324]MCT0230725.1 DUF429 domain-containing protein [Synechococcus sp. CS-1324]PZV01346.1 MAG: DUF429 domain-containing protein [Cyanobium sp.]